MSGAFRDSDYGVVPRGSAEISHVIVIRARVGHRKTGGVNREKQVVVPEIQDQKIEINLDRIMWNGKAESFGSI